ncbi:hypothetical protein [Sporosarcina pasteurii]|uniref:Uncharacterized protein n=1 Tax=Sporosarcina pasteurii TaxID=1474 RepID=A0A380C462_SPOPA|nr:hypothetical protein [Sporosarcina pasteurii]MDS9471596.1 hypothetical protein [Sporosarcina pasteurii]QBQ04790.1 hypothetical protein E2C16_03485 [Sporosarcina pasteurii]SUJ11247.1 Uncharacterised protein [Sporosarcina pasteurii]
MTKNDKDLLKNELKKHFPDMKQFNEILDQVELNVVDKKSNFEVKEVNIDELEAIKRAALSKDGRFESVESNESKKYIELLNEVKNQLTSLDMKLDIIIQYLEVRGK